MFANFKPDTIILKTCTSGEKERLWVRGGQFLKECAKTLWKGDGDRSLTSWCSAWLSFSSSRYGLFHSRDV